MSKEICSECKYAQEKKSFIAPYLACKRYPQEVKVMLSNFCGEFSVKVKAKKKVKSGK